MQKRKDQEMISGFMRVVLCAGLVGFSAGADAAARTQDVQNAVVNGEPIKSPQHMIEAGEGDAFIVFESSNGRKIVLDRNAVKKIRRKNTQSMSGDNRPLHQPSQFCRGVNFLGL